MQASETPNTIGKIKITGKIVEKSTNQPLEYATITFKNLKDSKATTGGITNSKGEFDVNIVPGIYDIKIEFISFKATEIKEKNLQKSSDLGTLFLSDDASKLNEVVIKAVKSSVDIRLDKKIFNVGQDLTAKGGTASDVLQNVPSVTLDSDGNVSLRGNENVKILIDGKPSNTINVADALKSISADALDKVEVITNPSSRYDAEGSAGIINIVLKKGKSNGVNGTLITTVGNPQNYGLVGTLNLKKNNFNLFSTIGYTDSKSIGKGIANTDYLNSNGSILKTINEKSSRERARKGYNYNFGIDWYLTKSLTWTNAISVRNNSGTSPDNIFSYNYELNNNFVRNRINNQITKANDFEYTTNFTKKFKKEGHKFTVDFTTSHNLDNDDAIITDFVVGQEANFTEQTTKNYQTQNRNLIQSDYVLPLGKNGQFEAGYKGDFNRLLTDYNVGNLDAYGNIINNVNLTNKLDYREKINALYTQYGSKKNKFSYLLGMRYEDSNIDINLLTTNDFHKKKYHNFFPSAFLTYQITEESSFSLNYSRRVMRPRSRFINPFMNYSSNVNLMQGNPNLNPSFTDAIDFGYMTKWDKLTVTSSVYFNKTKDVFQFIHRPNGEIVTSVVNSQIIKTPVLLAMPVNLAEENRFGFEFNVNYSPYKWWRINGNFNFYQSKINGAYSYNLIDSSTTVNEFLNQKALGWFSRLSSKVSLPFKIDWQTNIMYRAPQNTTQGRMLEVISASLAFSKEVLKSKGTVSLNASDIFNSDKFKVISYLPTANNYLEMQRRPRQINLSFTYRFNNNQKMEKPQPKKMQYEGDMDFQG
jgi:hypothetical protein